jgi:DHA1 family bicyclomycin/chloramphenicol resistance-like MFS transporter
MTKARVSNKFIILILGLLMTVSPFSIDMYLPGYSQIAKDLNTTSVKIALSLASYFVGIAIGQLLYGPLLDRYGRKKPLYFGLSLYILTCIGCMLSKSVEVLIIFRFIQALGGCVAIVAAIAMVRDFFPVNESAKILSMLMLILGLSPLLAPTIGGFIITSLGWHWVFIALAIIVFLILAITFIYLPEGHQPDRTVSLKIKPILADYFYILKTPQFYTYALSGAFSFATLFLYVAGSPLIFMEIFHVSPQMYGGIFALLSVGFIGGNQLNILILRKYKSEQIFRFALLFQFVTSIVFLVGALNNWYELATTIILFFILLSCLGLTYPNASAIALAPFSRNAGSASAMLGFLQIGIAGFASGCIGFFNSSNSVPIVTVMVGTSLIALVILMAGRRKLIIKLS